MNWLTPLGFLGFIGLVILLIIYIIKPNYQNKFISSTFLWKLSLRYRKKKVPLSKLRNILLIICQVLAISACAFILAQPFIDGEDLESGKEKVIIIDASASMRAEVEGTTRYQRAVEQATAIAGQTLEKGGQVTIILAGREADLLCSRLNAESEQEVNDILTGLGDLETNCTYGHADIDGAMHMAESVLEENPAAEVLLYTGTSYIDDGKVTVVDVSGVDEWNAAILGVRSVLVDGFYRFEVDMASYKRTTPVKLCMEINGARGTYGTGDMVESYSGGTLKLEYTANLEMDMQTMLSFGQDEKDQINDLKIYGYDYINCYIEVTDALAFDNTYYLYGGSPLPLKIQYYSSKANNFVASVLMDLRDQLKNDWDIDIKEIKGNTQGVDPEKEIAYEGYDIYIFEHDIPETLPTDGLVFIINPNSLPYGFDVSLGNELTYGAERFCSAGDAHDILNFVNAEEISMTRYTKINAYDSAYVPILYSGAVDSPNRDPVVLVKNTPESKVVLFSFSLHFSNLAVKPEFPILMYNILEYFIPTTFADNVYDLYDTVTLNSRSPSMQVVGPQIDSVFEEPTVQIQANVPGLYTVTQMPISGNQIVENFYVPVPAEQSNISRQLDSLTNPYFPPVNEATDLDLVFYFALAAVTLLFCEWWLKSRDWR